MLTRKVVLIPLLIAALSCGTYFWLKKKPAPQSHLNFQATVQIYSKTLCTYCVQAKDLLKGKGVRFEEIELGSTQPERRMEMLQRTGGKTSVPQIFINNRHIGGYSDLADLDYEGKLDPLLLQALPTQ